MSHHSGSGKRRWSSPVIGWLWRAAFVLFLVAGGVLTSASIAQWRLVPPKPPEVVQDVVVRNVPDQHGRQATFRILLFSDEFRWRLNSHLELENGVATPAFTPEMKAVLNSSLEVICVGASSEELPGALPPPAGRKVEERRAGRRASQIAVWVRSALSVAIPVRKLNIGQHVPTARARRQDTSDQRRVVIVLVLERDEHANLNEALRTAMTQESVRAPIFDALLTDYSHSKETEFTWEN
jgi:hypothetical protein